MGFWSFLTDDVNEIYPTYHNQDVNPMNFLTSLMTGNKGMEVTVDDALRVPTFKACHDIIVGAFKDLPIKLYKPDTGGNLVEVKQDYRLNLLNKAPNKFTTSADFKERFISDLVLYGNAYAEVESENGKIKALWNLKAEDVNALIYQNPNYPTRISGVDFQIAPTNYILDYDDVVCCVVNSEDGVTGKGALYYGEEIIKLALSEIELSNAIMKNGSAPASIIKVNGELSETALDALTVSWNNLFNGAKSRGKVLFLEENMDYKQVSLTPNELGLTTSRTTTGSELCRLMGIPEPLVDNTKNSYGSVEALNLMLIQNSLSPIQKCVVDGLSKILLTEKEYASGWVFKIDVSSAIKTTLKERFESYNAGLSGGYLSINEVREREGLLPLKEDMFKFSQGMVIYMPQRDEILNPNSSTTYNLQTGELSNPNIQLENGIKDNTEDEQKQNTSIEDETNNDENMDKSNPKEEKE